MMLSATNLTVTWPGAFMRELLRVMLRFSGLFLLKMVRNQHYLICIPVMAVRGLLKMSDSLTYIFWYKTVEFWT